MLNYPFQCSQVHKIRPIEWHPTKFYQKKGPSEWFGEVNCTGSTNRRFAADRSQAADQSVYWIEQNAPRQGIRSTVNARALLVFDAYVFDKRLTFSFQIFGISVNSNGYSWLQSVALHERVQFMPIDKSNVNYAECQVALLQSNKVSFFPSVHPIISYSCFSARFSKNIRIFTICINLVHRPTDQHRFGGGADKPGICTPWQIGRRRHTRCAAGEIFEGTGAHTGESLEKTISMADQQTRIADNAADIRQSLTS